MVEKETFPTALPPKAMSSVLEEAKVLHEVVYALLGHTGKVITSSSSRFDLSPSARYDPSERALLDRLLSLGHAYSQLDAFVHAQLFSAEEGGSAYLIALAAGLEECLTPYRTQCLQMEQLLLRIAATGVCLSLAELQLGLGAYELMVPELLSILVRIQNHRLSAAALLDFLHEKWNGAVATMRRCLSTLLWHVQRVLLTQLSGWLLHGEILPENAEFFIQPRQDARGRRSEEGSSGAGGGGTGGGGGGGGGSGGRRRGATVSSVTCC